MNDNKSITMKDIADALGISVATVSRALKNSSRISPERREEIQRFAREHNFTPNVVARDLRNTRLLPSRTIGVIVPELVHYYFDTVLSGIEEQARIRGYRVIIGQSHESYEREVETCMAFAEARVCGIIISLAKGTSDYSHFRELQAAGLPLVFFGPHHTFDLYGGFSSRTSIVLAPVFSFPALSYLPCHYSSVHYGCRNLNLLSIDYAFLPRLRPRLTQGRSALPWKPWIFGRKDSHLSLATHSGILSS